jgi:hypothetical protein
MCNLSQVSCDKCDKQAVALKIISDNFPIDWLAQIHTEIGEPGSIIVQNFP